MPASLTNAFAGAIWRRISPRVDTQIAPIKSRLDGIDQAFEQITKAFNERMAALELADRQHSAVSTDAAAGA